MTPAPTGLLRYGAVGAVATASHWAVLVLLVETAGVVPWLASGIGAVVGAQVAFVGNRRFTFAHAGPWWPAWPRFMATALVGAAFGMAVVALASRAGLHYLVGQAVATLLVMLLTYAINRRWTFA